MTPTNVKELVNLFIGIINPLLLLIAGASLLIFFKGLAAFIFKSGDEKALEEGKGLMTWGLVGLFVMVSLWGILSFAYTSLALPKSLGIPLLPHSK
ncbi:hypothetical protein KW800_02595 [Candidatus Parcubacteria bacterium]|nr:hypothetical protein [Candidatus Parcubacteria bacterium]